MFTLFTNLVAYLIGDLTCTSRDNARVLRPVLRETKGAIPLRLLSNIRNSLINPLMVLAATSTLFAACKKTSDDPMKNSGSRNIELLTSSTWKLSKIEYLQKDGTWINGTIGYTQEGATLSFNTDNTYNAFATNISAATGTWKFSAENAQLTMVNNKTMSGQTFSVNTLNKATLQLGYSGTVIVYGGVDDLERFTYDGERDTFVH